MGHTTKADGGVIVSWGLWFFANLTGINMVLQFIALVAAITASALAIRYHLRRGDK